MVISVFKALTAVRSYISATNASYQGSHMMDGKLMNTHLEESPARCQMRSDPCLSVLPFSPLLPLGSVLLGPVLRPAPLTSSATPRGGLRTCNVVFPSKTRTCSPQHQPGSRRLLLVPPAGGHYPVSAQVRVQSWAHPRD